MKVSTPDGDHSKDAGTGAVRATGSKLKLPPPQLTEAQAKEHMQADEAEHVTGTREQGSEEAEANAAVQLGEEGRSGEADRPWH